MAIIFRHKKIFLILITFFLLLFFYKTAIYGGNTKGRCGDKECDGNECAANVDCNSAECKFGRCVGRGGGDSVPPPSNCCTGQYYGLTWNACAGRCADVSDCGGCNNAACIGGQCKSAYYSFDTPCTNMNTNYTACVGTSGCSWTCAPPCNPNSWGQWSNCSKPCDDGTGSGTQSRTNACGTSQTQSCNTFSCYISYPTPTPLPPGLTVTPTPTPSPRGYFPGWFKTERGDVHSNQDIIVSLPSLLERFATYLVTTANLSSFAARSDNDARPELGSVNGWAWYSPPYGAVSFPENAGFYSYYTRNKPAEKKLVTDNITNSLISGNVTVGKAVKLQIDSTVNSVSVSENISLNSDQLLVLYINGDLNVDNNINLTGNSGIVFIVKGNLNINPSVTEADGFYLVDQTVNSTDGSGAGGPLLMRGGVFVSQSGKIFGTSRQINDYTIPSEKIIYEPKYLINFAQGLGHEGIVWREVAP